MAENEKTYGALAFFKTPGELLEAARKVREAGFKKFDCHSPFPIHGMDQAMGLSRSVVGYVSGICALLGGSFGMWLQWWTSTVDYPLVISGKPLFSFQAYVIVTFGLTILGAALGAVIGMLMINRLPRYFHGSFYSSNFGRFSDDAFVVSIESDDEKFDEAQVQSFLSSIGGQDVEIVRGA